MIYTKEEVTEAKAYLKKLNSQISIYEQLNTALPKKRAEKFEKILNKLYSKRQVHIFNNKKILNG